MLSINDIIKKYIGIPFKENGNTLEGLDCINLCVMISKDRDCELILPNHNYTADTSHIAFNNYRNTDTYYRVDKQADSLVLLRIDGINKHVGYVLDDKHFIHVSPKKNVTVERLSKWKNHIVGYYKWKTI